MIQDLILGVLGTQWERTRPGGVNTYLESVKRSGFKGSKVMLVWDIHVQTRADLLKHGFELIDLPTPLDSFFHARVRVVYEYLKEHHKEFRWIHWLDVKDLILQSDPSKWVEQNSGKYSLIGSSESVAIKHEETNWLWANEILGPSKAAEIADCPVFNGGAFSAKAEVLAEFFHQVHILCQRYSGGYPPCQVSMAYVANTAFKSEFYQPHWSEGYAMCPHPTWSPWRMPCWPYMQDPHPVLDIDTCNLHAGTVPNFNNPMIVFNPLWGNNVRVPQMADRKLIIETPSHPLQGVELVKKPQGKMFSILHGYDRDWDMKALFEFKYRVGEKFSLEAVNKQQETAVASLFEDYKKYNEEMAKLLPRNSRGLRRPGRESTSSNYQLPQSGRVFSRHT